MGLIVIALASIERNLKRLRDQDAMGGGPTLPPSGCALDAASTSKTQGKRATAVSQSAGIAPPDRSSRNDIKLPGTQRHKSVHLAQIVEEIDTFRWPKAKASNAKGEDESVAEEASKRYQQLHAEAYEEWSRLFFSPSSITAQSASHSLTDDDLIAEFRQHREVTDDEIFEVKQRYEAGEALHEIIGSLGPFPTVTAIMTPGTTLEISPEVRERYRQEMETSACVAPPEDDEDL